jgi:hypothetical protein
VALYVYYRVREADAAAALAAFRAARGASLEPRLMRRPEGPQGLQTWMEVYDGAPEDAEPRIAAALAAWISGERHLEHFVPLA